MKNVLSLVVLMAFAASARASTIATDKDLSKVGVNVVCSFDQGDYEQPNTKLILKDGSSDRVSGQVKLGDSKAAKRTFSVEVYQQPGFNTDGTINKALALALTTTIGGKEVQVTGESAVHIKMYPANYDCWIDSVGQ